MGFSIRQAIFEYRRYTLLPLHTAIWRWIKNRDVRYSLINQEDWQKYKTSDTIFLFGSGPSINDITGEQWEVIKAHDSFGMNYSFLTKFPTTYFYLGYEPSSNNILSQSFSEDIRVIYEKSLWLLPMKVLYRLTYPRTVPYFFPPNARIALFDFPQGIKLETDRPFKIEDFHHSLIYRGSMGLGIHLMDLLGYKNIVLMGVDLHTYRHFYDNFEVMKKERGNIQERCFLTGRYF